MVFIFKNGKDVKRIRTGKWLWGSSLLALKLWSPFQPIWVKLSMLPMEFWSEAIPGKMGTVWDFFKVLGRIFVRWRILVSNHMHHICMFWLSYIYSYS